MGAGRKPVVGRTRNRRVMVQLTDQEFEQLHALAAKHEEPMGLIVYRLLARWLEQKRRR